MAAILRGNPSTGLESSRRRHVREFVAGLRSERPPVVRRRSASAFVSKLASIDLLPTITSAERISDDRYADA
jgi:hypothetical protein